MWMENIPSRARPRAASTPTSRGFFTSGRTEPPCWSPRPRIRVVDVDHAGAFLLSAVPAGPRPPVRTSGPCLSPSDQDGLSQAYPFPVSWLWKQLQSPVPAARLADGFLRPRHHQHHGRAPGSEPVEMVNDRVFYARGGVVLGQTMSCRPPGTTHRVTAGTGRVGVFARPDRLRSAADACGASGSRCAAAADPGRRCRHPDPGCP